MSMFCHLRENITQIFKLLIIQNYGSTEPNHITSIIKYIYVFYLLKPNPHLMNLSQMGPVDGHLCKCRPHNLFFELQSDKVVSRFKGTIVVSTNSGNENFIPIKIYPQKASKNLYYI